MTDPQKSSSWWQTVPGVLTALAALITALSGLAALLFQYGVLGSKNEPSSSHSPSPPIAASAPVSTQPASAANAPLPGPAGGKAWADTEAVVLTREGATTRLRANSLSNCISVDHELTLENGQAIPFEAMAAFEVLRSDDHTQQGARAKVRVTLTAGGTMEGTVKADCDLFGYNDMGRFTTYFDRIQSVRFER
jgi:hypothetical protein